MPHPNTSAYRFILLKWTGTLFGLLLLYIAWRYPSPPRELLAGLGVVLLSYNLFTGWLISRLFQKLEASKNELYEQSIRDPLTDLGNMRYFRDQLQQALAYARRYETNFGIVLFDLDDFKAYNDRLGHLTGDEILRRVAGFFDAQTREEETVVRYGGDEFIVLMPYSSEEEVLQGAERIRSELEANTIKLEEEELSVRVSGGVAIYPEDGSSDEELLNAADRNLYRAKKVGNRVASRALASGRERDRRSVIIGHQDRYLDAIAKKSNQVYLLAKAGDIEVIKQRIEAGRIFRVFGEEPPDSFETIYIMRGRIRHQGENHILRPGSFIITPARSEEVYFKALTETVLLHIANTPVFKAQQKKIQRLLSLNREVARKDQRTEAHCDRLQELATRTGEELGIETEDLFPLIYASFLHDIGKVNIPSSILVKKGELSQQEWEQIKKHPIWSRDLILKRLQLEDFKDVAETVHQHHERYDGQGYPQGLKGEDIRLEAQILSIADAYDAMTSDRPYRKAMPREEARRQLKQESGRQFAPHIVDAFLRAEEKLYRELEADLPPAE